MANYRIYVEKRPAFQVEAKSLKNELNENLQLNLQSLRYINVYDLFGFTPELLEQCRYSVFGETVTDTVTDDCDLTDKKYLAVEYLPGQFDQRASSAVDCVHLIDPNAEVEIRSSRLLVFDKQLTDAELDKIRHYYINAVESREKDLSQLSQNQTADVKPLAQLDGFITMPRENYAAFCKEWGLAMNTDDLHGDARYLSEIRRCNEQRSKLLGLNLPHSQQETTSATLVWNECKNYGTDDKTNRGS